MSDPKLQDVIDEFREKLPGWWFTVGDCYVSADSSMAPDPNAPEWPGYDIEALIKIDKRFDEGFHLDIRHPWTMAKSMKENMDCAVQVYSEALRQLGYSA